MPTNKLEPEFFRDYARLTLAQRTLFKQAVRDFVDDLKHKRPFRSSLRVRGVQGHHGIFEMTWEMPNGRATFAYGDEQVPGEPHIIWRRVGGHDIFKNP
jgi:hypothetical protein